PGRRWPATACVWPGHPSHRTTPSHTGPQPSAAACHAGRATDWRRPPPSSSRCRRRRPPRRAPPAGPLPGQSSPTSCYRRAAAEERIPSAAAPAAVLGDQVLAYALEQLVPGRLELLHALLLQHPHHVVVVDAGVLERGHGVPGLLVEGAHGVAADLAVV